MISEFIERIFLKPFVLIFKFLRRHGRAGARKARVNADTAIKSGGSAVAKTTSIEILDEELRIEPPSGIEAAMFKQLPRPRLTEKSASELSLEQANAYAGQAARFYDFRFALFPGGELFYEEIEDEYLNTALGYDADSIDRRFIDVTTLFRKTLNDNTRRLMFFWTPLIGAGFLAAAAFMRGVLSLDWLFQFNQLTGENIPGEAIVYYSIAALLAGFIIFMIYSWPYKVVQQRNLMNLDNYVTSKFARINNNFQVAKRRALNVERNKRMSERDALRDEAGSWTLSYHWFAVRLFLCELMLRNKFYQVRRNSTLYWIGGLAITVLLLGAFAFLYQLGGSGAAGFTGLGAGAALYSVVAGAATARASAMMIHVLKTNEWSRFHLINLDETIRDHVGEDKLQIVTFRDRNRFE